MLWPQNYMHFPTFCQLWSLKTSLPKDFRKRKGNCHLLTEDRRDSIEFLWAYRKISWRRRVNQSRNFIFDFWKQFNYRTVHIFEGSFCLSKVVFGSIISKNCRAQWLQYSFLLKQNRQYKQSCFGSKLWGFQKNMLFWNSFASSQPHNRPF